MPIDLGVNWFDAADDDLHSLGGQRVELLWQLKDLMGFHLVLLSYVDKLNEDAEKQAVSSVWDRQDLYPARQHTVTLQTFSSRALIQTDLF